MRILIMALAVVLSATGALAEETARITVAGEGRVEAVPDMALVTVGVTAEADTAKAAMDQVSAGVGALFAELAASGIEARDTQTSGLSLNPRWVYDPARGGEGRIDGYTAMNTVTVRVRAVERLGGVLDGMLEAGANTFHGVGFALQEPGPKLDEARTLAVADARRKAELLAEAAGVTLGPILSISEELAIGGPQPMFRMEAGMGGDAMPVAPGEAVITARVIVAWEIGG